MKTMKANELRIGNLVYCNNKVWEEYLKDKPVIVSGVKSTVRLIERTPDFSVSFIDESCYNQEYNQYIEFISPIPLTPDWLSSFGAKKNGTQLCFKIGKNYGALIMMNGTCDFYDYKGRTIAIIKYVHELQNLYFALTGEELKLLIKNV